MKRGIIGFIGSVATDITTAIAVLESKGAHKISIKSSIENLAPQLIPNDESMTRKEIWL